MHAVYSSSVETVKKLARIDRITAIFSNVREHVRKENTYVMVVYASPPLSGGGVEPPHAKLATFPQCGHLWPSSVFKHSPVDEFQIFTDLSSLPLASSPALDQATVLTQLLPFSQM